MSEIETQISNYKKSKSLEDLETYYKKPSFLELLGVDRKEVVHTKFLAWLFGLKEDTNNNKPIQLFLDYLFAEDVKQSRATVCNPFFNITDIKIETEKGNKNRFDLIIKFKNNGEKTKVIVENKVHSAEYNKQTHRYFEHQVKDTKIYFAYLSPTTNNKLVRENFLEINENFVLLNYQGILDEVLTKLNYRDKQINLFIEEYILTLSKSWTLHLKNKKQYNAMAFTNNQRELLNEFWQENNNLILLAMESISEDDAYSEEVKQDVKTALDSLKDYENKRGLQFYLESKDAQSEPFIINDIVKQILLFSESNEDVFNIFLDNRNFNTYPLVIKKSGYEYRANTSRYGTKKVFMYKKSGDRTTYACVRNWDINNVKDLTAFVEKEFGIKLKEVI